MVIICALCPVPVKMATEEISEHVRLLHPDHYEGEFELWPDGKFVVTDETAKPVPGR
jgi:hypothetical protein